MMNLDGVSYIGHASFFFTDAVTGNKIYYIDPFELGERAFEKADIIFITHAHPDHFSPHDIDSICKPESVIVAPVDVTHKLSGRNSVSVEPNKDYSIKDFSFHTVPAYNTAPEKQTFHPKENNWVGYIFTVNSKKVYHAGDTDFIPEMNEFKKYNLDVAFLPVGGYYTMGVEEAAKAANAIGARYTVPMHYKRLLGEGYKETERQFKKLVTSSEVVILPECT